MQQQEYVRKYMIKDIVKRNLKFWWLIIVCVIAVAFFMGYRKNAYYQKRFATVELKGIRNQYTIEYYTGNVDGETMPVRLNNAMEILTSQRMLDEFNSLWGKSIEYGDFKEIATVSYNETNDILYVHVEYPWGSESITLLEDDDVREFIEYYVKAVQNVSDSVIGEDGLELLGVSDVSTIEYKASDEERATARKIVIKNAFIGAVIGFIIPVAVITLLYIAGGTLHTPQEVAYHANARLLATLASKKGRTDYAELGQALAFVGYRYGKENLAINLLGLCEIDGALVEAFGKMIADQGFSDTGINVIDMRDGVICDGGSIHGNVNILVAKTGKITADRLEKAEYALDLFDSAADGVIVYDAL